MRQSRGPASRRSRRNGRRRARRPRRGGPSGGALMPQIPRLVGFDKRTDWKFGGIGIHAALTAPLLGGGEYGEVKLCRFHCSQRVHLLYSALVASLLNRQVVKF